MIKFDKNQTEFLEYNLIKSEVVILKACPGSGKSTVIAEKVRLLVDSGVDPNSIIIITFSNRSSQSLKRKIRLLIGDDYKKCIISTIHGMMIHFIESVNGIKPHVISKYQSLSILKSVLNDLNIEIESNSFINKLKKLIEYYCVNFDNIPILEYNILEYKNNIEVSNDDFQKIIIEYDKIKRKRELWDYNDLIGTRGIDVVKDYDFSNFNYVFGDEWQDVSMDQYRLINSIFGNRISLVLACDIFQEIYSFRWSCTLPITSSDWFINSGFKNIEYFDLPYNYRSTSNIVNFFNLHRKLNGDGFESISTKNSVPGSAIILTADYYESEGDIIYREMMNICKDGFEYKDIVVLCRRSSYIKEIIDPCFSYNRIPYKIISSSDSSVLYKNNNLVRLYINLLSLFVDPKNIMYIFRCLDLFDGYSSFRVSSIRSDYINFGKIYDKNIYEMLFTIRKWKVDFVDYTSIYKLLKKIRNFVVDLVNDRFLFSDQIDNIEQNIIDFVDFMVSDFGITNLSEIFESMVSEIDYFYSFNDNKVSVSTIHQWKGLESKVVFVADLGSVGDDKSEDKILYVAMSRALERLIMIDSEYKSVENIKIKNKLSSSYIKTKFNLMKRGI